MARGGRYAEITQMDGLQTNAEKQALQEWKDARINDGTNDPDAYDMSGYLSRQPRLELRNKNFNFEQFSTYTQIYEEARAQDEADSKHFYKLVKYVMAKQEKGQTDGAVRDFLKKYKLDLI